jgi:hypothetical protein
VASEKSRTARHQNLGHFASPLRRD